MKRITKIMTCAGMLAMVLCCASPAMSRNKKRSGEPKAVFEETTYDFGSIEERKGPVSHDFTFVNEGDGNFIIIDAKAECGCTRPEYPKEPVAPGRKKAVKVTYNPSGRPGPFQKTVTLTTNGMPRKVRLKIRGTVK